MIELEFQTSSHEIRLFATSQLGAIYCNKLWTASHNIYTANSQHNTYIMAHHPQQSTSSFRSRRDDTGSLDGSDIVHQQHQSPPSLPLFSTTSSSDHTITNSSTLSSKSGSSDGGGGTTANMLNNHNISSNTVTPSAFKGAKRTSNNHSSRRKLLAQDTHNRALCKKALMQNDSMVYLGAYKLCSYIILHMHSFSFIHVTFLLLKFCCPALSMLSSRWTTGIYLWKL